MKRWFLAFLLIVPVTASAYDKQVAQRIYMKCALCHSHYAQGIRGGRYARLAGMDAEYMVQAMKDFAEGVRVDTAMTVISGLRGMPEEDMMAVAKYIESINLSDHIAFQIPNMPGNVERGEELFQDECKNCHGRKGEGKPRKGAPMLAGQYPQYLDRQIHFFKTKRRNHDRDPEDETFATYKPADLQDILSYISTLDDK